MAIAFLTPAFVPALVMGLSYDTGEGDEPRNDENSDRTKLTAENERLTDGKGKAI